MKTKYICDYCGAEWLKEEDCIACENSHKDEIESKDEELTNAKEELIARYDMILNKIDEEGEYLSTYLESVKERKDCVNEYQQLKREFQEKYPEVEVTTVDPRTNQEITLVKPESIDSAPLDPTTIINELFKMFD